AEDCGLILKIIGGPDRLDPTTAAAPVWHEARAARLAQGLTIGIPESYYIDGLAPETAKAMDDTIAALQALGCTIRKAVLPDQTLLSAAAQVIVTVEAASYHAPWMRTRPGDY